MCVKIFKHWLAFSSSVRLRYFSLVKIILGDPGAVSWAGRKGATKVFKHRRKSPWVPTLTGPFPNGQANADPDWAQKKLCIIAPNRPVRATTRSGGYMMTSPTFAKWRHAEKHEGRSLPGSLLCLECTTLRAVTLDNEKSGVWRKNAVRWTFVRSWEVKRPNTKRQTLISDCLRPFVSAIYRNFIYFLPSHINSRCLTIEILKTNIQHSFDHN